jgi:hypothetical protein
VPASGGAPRSFRGAGVPERVAVVKHEALHLLFRHLFRRDPARHRPALYNVAADLVVNQFVGAPWRLPPGAIVLATFPDLGLAEDRSLDWCYERLAALAAGGAAAERAPESAAALERLLAGPPRHASCSGWSPAAVTRART